MPPQELVLCSERSALPAEWLPLEGSVALSENALFYMLAHIEPRWIRRDQAEGDPRFKQWIPYVLVQRPDNLIATYRRQGAESRLHGFLSVGVGGHVNPEDATPLSSGVALWESALRGGLRRELAEEFPSAAVGITQFIGLINEDTSEVGRVHLGAVFLHRCEEWDNAGGGELTCLEWVSPIGLDQGVAMERFETWSRFALGLLLAR